jgi:hypothetical protein
VTAGEQRAETAPDGRATFSVAPGSMTLTVIMEGFVEARQEVTVPASGIAVTVDLVAVPGLEEEVVVVATTRTGRRVEDQPTRVEVLGREEIEEKMLMTPGDIVMMLNEMGGLRVQATSPSVGRQAGTRGSSVAPTNGTRTDRLTSPALPIPTTSLVCSRKTTSTSRRGCRCRLALDSIGTASTARSSALGLPD